MLDTSPVRVGVTPGFCAQ